VNLDRVFNIAGAIVTVALVAVVVQNGTKTAQVVSALGNGFAGAINAAQTA
jgi:hypothetical protein